MNMQNIVSTINFKARMNLSLSNKEKMDIHYKIANQELGKPHTGSLGLVYKYYVNGMPLAIKILKDVNKSRNLQFEADVLEKIPSDCKRTQQLVEKFNINDKEYLVSSYIEGDSLHDLYDKISDKQFDNILDELYKYEKSGMAFYDFSGANIKSKKDNEVGFFDFECYKKQPINTPHHETISDTNHQNRNIYNPRVTNIAAFEIRTIGKVLGYLEQNNVKNAEERSNNFVKRYLKALSKFYTRTAKMYEKCIQDDILSKNKIIEYEKTLARIFKNPSPDVINIEKQMMRLRELTTERSFRNDPDLQKDDELYNNPIAYKKDLIKRFKQVKRALSVMKNSNNSDIKDYANSTIVYCNRMANCWLNIDYK